MANINLRLYGDQIYPNISKYITKYISPEIQKDEFVLMYKSGILELKEISLKESFCLNQQIKIENAFISSIRINIPDEKENFGISINNIKCLLTISDIDENEVEKLLIEEKKKIITEFIDFAVKKIQKKDGASFFDNLINSVIEKIINGLFIDVEKLELNIKMQKKDNIYLTFLVEDMHYSFDKGIIINNTNVLYQEEQIKTNIIEKFSINIDFKKLNENNESNKINININNVNINLNKKIFFFISNILNIFDEANYTKIYIIYKKLILYYKPKIIENEKKDLKALWRFAIKTIIKIHKYLKYKKYNIFNLANFSQMKIMENYLKNKENEDKILFAEDINILKATKKEVEKKILNDKNSNVLANAFSFFFGAKKEDKKDELTEEEKQIMEDIYKEENIFKYLNNEIGNTSNSFNIIFEKIKSFLSKISINFDFNELQVNLKNENKLHDFNFFMKALKFEINYIENNLDFKLYISDIGFKNNISLFLKKNSQHSIIISRDKEGAIELKLGFETIQINLEEFKGIFIFMNSIKTEKRRKIFYDKLNIVNQERNKDFINQIKNNIINFSFRNFFKLSNIPSLSILAKDNNIEMNIFDYSLEENSIKFHININDSYGKIINDLYMKLELKENNLFVPIEAPIEITFQKEFFLNAITYYFEYKKEIVKVNQNNNENLLVKPDKLFEFNNIYESDNFEMLDISEYNLNISIKKIEIKVYKEKTELENSFFINDIQLLYDKNKFDFNFNKTTLFIDLKSSLFSDLFNAETQNIDKDSINKQEQLIEAKNIYENTAADDPLNKFNFNGKDIIIELKSDKPLISLNLNNIKLYKNEDNKNINLLVDFWIIKDIRSESKNKNNIIIKSDKLCTIKYEIFHNFIQVEMDSIFSDINITDLKEIYNNISFLIKENKEDIQQKKEEFYKFELNITNFRYELLDKYNVQISKINIHDSNEKGNKYPINFIKLEELVINNINEKKLLNSKQLDINYISSSEEGNIINFNCNEIFINLSKNDFSFLTNSLKSNQDQNTISINSIVVKNNNNEKVLTSTEKDIQKNSEEKYNNSNIIINASSNEQEKQPLKINICLLKIDLSFCKNDNYEKIIELSMTKFNINSIIREIFISKDFDCNLTIGNMDFIYYDEIYSEIVNVLSKRKKELTENQVEFKYSNNNTEININNNEINLRIDSFLIIYYYFVGNESFKKTYKKIKENFDIKKYFKISILNSRFKLITSFEGKENLFLDINTFNINYDNHNFIFPFGDYDFFLDRISSDIILKNETRKLFETGQNVVKINLKYYEKSNSINMEFGNLIINLSYRDLVSFIRVYELNLKLINSSMNKINSNANDFEKQKEIISEHKEKIHEQKEISKNIETSGAFSLENLNITLIDNSKGSYQPFLNFNIKDLFLSFSQEKAFTSRFSFRFSTYNYIACFWEPAIEKLDINSNGSYTDNGRIKIVINNLLMNISDMAYSFTLIIFNNWLTKLDIKTKKFKQKEIKFNRLPSKKIKEKSKKSTKITNNQLINYTGTNLSLIHNGKKIECSPLQKIELDNSNTNEIKDLKKTQYMTLIYDKKNKFEIPLGKIVTLTHKINDKLFILSENTLSESKTINISLYSPFIIKNKTPFSIKIQIINKVFGNQDIILKPNEICGLPLSLNIPTISICFFLEESKQFSDQNKSETYSLSEILNTNNFKKKLNFSTKSFTMQMFKKFKIVRMLVIYSEYNIINCLPCNIIVDYFKKKDKIEKCTQLYISENYIKNLFVQFTINTELGIFTSERYDLINLNNQLDIKGNLVNQFLTFKNSKLGKKFLLNYTFKRIEEEKVFIIYSELILYNRSGLDIKIININPNNLNCIKIEDKIGLISSNIDYKEEKLKFKNNYYTSKEIKIHELIQISNNMSINMLDLNFKKPFDIIVKKKLSYIKIKNNPNFGENIISIVFSIYPMCRIFNLLSGKKILICDNKDDNKNTTSLFIKPFEASSFYFFNKGYERSFFISALNLDENSSKELSKVRFQNGICTLITNDFFFNLDIKKNPTAGCVDVYILENNMNNSQAILENLSDEEISIYQKNYEQKPQILKSKEIAPLKIYDYISKIFVFSLNKKVQEVNIGDIRNQKIINLTDKISAIIQDNGMKIKITFYPKAKYDLINQNSINFNFDIRIESIYISIIGDNEIQNPKLTKYERFEILLITLNTFELNINVKQTIGLLNENSIYTKLTIMQLNVYNQLSSEGNFACVLKSVEKPPNIPFFSLENETIYHPEGKVINFHKQKIEIKKLKLGIDPDFMSKFLTFYDDLLMRMNLTYYNISKVFLDKKENLSKKLINKQYKGRILINANGLLFPKLEIDIKIVEKGLKELLKERIACSDFYIWVAKGLVGRTQNVLIKSSVSNYINGTLVQYYVWVYYKYMNQFEEKITEMGFKGIMGHIISGFNQNKVNKEFKKNRLREPRPFYGKYKYFKEYDENDVEVIKSALLINKNKIQDKQNSTKIIKDKNYLFLFTNCNILCFNSKKHNLIWKYDYNIIDKSINSDNSLMIFYKNRQVKNNNAFESCNCENSDISNEVATTINEEIVKYRDNIIANYDL